jgi:hypothetical protein
VDCGHVIIAAKKRRRTIKTQSVNASPMAP